MVLQKPLNSSCYDCEVVSELFFKKLSSVCTLPEAAAFDLEAGEEGALGDELPELDLEPRADFLRAVGG